MKKSSPMHVNFYNYRVEFQLRGAGHIHGVLWLDLEALKSEFPNLQKAFSNLQFGKDLSNLLENELINFADKFITCSLENSTKNIASQVQFHNHSKSCRKYNTICRFNFPKYPSEKTIITYKLQKNQFDTEKEYKNEKKNYRHFNENY
jgi:hypothetical protein